MANQLYRAPIIRSTDIKDRDSYRALCVLRDQLQDLTFNRRLQPSVRTRMVSVLSSCIRETFYDDAAKEFDQQLQAIATRELSGLHWQYEYR